MNRGIIAVMLLGFSLLAGCVSHSSNPSSETTAAPSTSGSSTTTSETATPPRGSPPASALLLLTNCTSWMAPALFPGSTGPGSPPPGWDPSPPGNPTTGVAMNGYLCNRLNIGHFERGPVHLLIEGHTNGDFPANCTATQQPTIFGILHTFWIDDAAVATYLNTTYGLPILVGDFHESDQPSGALVAHTWTWGQPGQTPSELTVYDDQTEAAVPPNNDLLFWPRNGGIASLEIQYDRTAPGGVLGNRLATGTLAPPMLLANVGGGHYAGGGAWYPSMPQGIGTFRQYSDPKCLHPM